MQQNLMNLDLNYPFIKTITMTTLTKKNRRFNSKNNNNNINRMNTKWNVMPLI